MHLHTESWGAGGPRALLVPGITSTAATMWEVGEGLAAAGWTAVAVDLPGHGDSPPAASHRFADVAETVAAQLGDGWDLVVAHSLGGAIATVLLAAHPATAARALLVDPALRVPDDVADGLAPELRRDQAGQTEALVAAANPHWHPRTVAERVRSTRSTDVAAVEGYAADNRPWDVRAAARAVRVPVHVLVPTDDPLVTGDQVHELTGVTDPPWTFETVPDTTHSLHRDRPALVVDRALGSARR
ncbi:alpha/beta fold hydrolase [Blastococcus sp. SYSU D00813]